ncbi:hypothetical protein [Bifidobacterium sp. UTBIF-78]|uniref:hypothetical protein n=1 Tax=Bifidobacterium sp. UTBIF-78 TaxID=1465263 RepID=UPI001125E8EB|nr:hypothetical protein [Bifidobacterium sp. UTBIF-78]TPF94465.1 hypothetical protein BG22_05275 [Bifidobacterium sp. UTBIF-78]
MNPLVKKQIGLVMYYLVLTGFLCLPVAAVRMLLSPTRSSSDTVIAAFALLLTVFLTVFEGYFFIRNAKALARGPQHTPAVLLEVTEEKDYDDDPVTVCRFRTEDGRTIVLQRSDPNLNKAFADPAVAQALTEPGTWFDLEMYDRPMVCRFLRVDSKRPRETLRETPKETSDALSNSTSSASAAAKRAHDDITIANLDYKSVSRLHAVTLTVMVVLVIAAVILHITLSGFGMQGVIRRMLFGLTAAAWAACSLMHLIVKLALGRQARIRQHIKASAVGTDIAKTAFLHAAFIAICTVVAVTLMQGPVACLRKGPITVPAMYSGKIPFIDRHYFSFRPSGGESRLISIEIDDDRVDEARTLMPRKDLPVLLTYWPGGDENVFDHVAPDPSRS